MATAPEYFHYEISETIRSLAMGLPETSEGTSCVNRAFKAGSKNFAFLGEKDDECGLRLKLDASIPDVTARSTDDDRYQVGKGGWTMLKFSPKDPPPTDDLERWLVESYRLLAPKKIVALLDQE